MLAKGSFEKATPWLWIGLLCAGWASYAMAEQVPVRYTEGDTKGFLILRSADGKELAEGDLTEKVRGGTVTTRVVFRFKDGSVYEDTTEFTQHGKFRLKRDHVVQKGPAFKQQMESVVDVNTGEVTVTSSDGKKEKKYKQKMDLPEDVANGMVFTFVKDLRSNPVTTVSYVAATPKPRLVKLVITQNGKEKLMTGNTGHQAIHYVMRVKIGGITGVAAKIFGKLPPPTEMWVLDSDVPAFAGSKGPLSMNGPVWRVELVSPRQPKVAETEPEIEH